MNLRLSMKQAVILRQETNDDRLGGSEYEHSWLRLISVERLRLAGRVGRLARHTARRDAERSTRGRVRSTNHRVHQRRSEESNQATAREHAGDVKPALG